MTSSDDRLLDFNENTVGPRPLVEEEIRGIPADQYVIYPEHDGVRGEVAASLWGTGFTRARLVCSTASTRLVTQSVWLPPFSWAGLRGQQV